MITVVIDPGHGGGNIGVVRGNLGVDRLIEKDVNLSISRRVFEGLSAIGSICPILLREDDDELSLSARSELSEKFGADLVLSIHVNASPDPHVRGLMVFHWPGNFVGERVGISIARATPAELYRKHERSYAVSGDIDWLKHARAVLGVHKSTSVLIEVGHATNNVDRRYLLSDPGQAAIANAVIAGAIEFWKLQQERKTA